MLKFIPGFPGCPVSGGGAGKPGSPFSPKIPNNNRGYVSILKGLVTIS